MEYKTISVGDIGTEAIPRAIIDQLTELPHDHSAYFDLSIAHMILPTGSLVASRARPEGIVNANRFMRLAAEGKMDKRSPISVKKLADGTWAVVDGNSTFINALCSGWPDIPCALLG